MKKILVPTDFSTCANHAVDFAVQSAKHINGEVILFHALESGGSAYTDYMGVNKEFDQFLINEQRDKLRMIKKSIEETEGITVGIYLLKGPLKESILQAIDDKEIDLVVMGTLGASGIKKKIWGSNTAAVIGNTKIPVMVIPFFYEWKKPQKILIATNHFEKEPAILDFVFELADLYMAQVHIAVFSNEDKDDAATLLEHTRKTPRYEKLLKTQYLEDTLTAEHLYGNEFEKTLNDHLNKKEIDVLAMVTYSKGGLWEKFFHPSLTKKMSYHTKIPLLVLPGIETES